MNFDKDNPNVYWKRVTIPKGLPAILEALAKESMRENPEELIPFLSKVVDDLIAKRDQEEVLEKGGSRSGANTASTESEGSGGAGVSLTKISKVGSGKRKLEEENPLLEKETAKPQYTAEVDEELAASKIQAGFRGYQTRKLLKESNVTAKGGGLPLTSLTPLQQEQDAIAETPQAADDNESAAEKIVIDVDDDEAIAAELKTPLETIREESLDGSLRMKTPEVVHIENVEAPLLSADISSQPILEEEGENSAAQDDEEEPSEEKEPEELPEDDANPDEIKEKDSEPIVAEEESSETPIVSKDLSYEEQTPDSLGSLNKSSDKDEQSSEAEAIGETEIETLVEETDSKLNVEQAELLPEGVAEEAEEKIANAPEELVAAVPEDAPQAVENNETPVAIEDEEITGSSLVSSAELEEQPGEVTIVVDTAEDDAIVIEAEEEDSEKVNSEDIVDDEPASTSKIPNHEADDQDSKISPEVVKEEISDIPKTPDAVEEKSDAETSISEVVQDAESEKNAVTVETEVEATPEFSQKSESPSSPVPEPSVTSPTLQDEPAIPPAEEESTEKPAEEEGTEKPAEEESTENPAEEESTEKPAEATQDSGESTEKVGESSDDTLQNNKEEVASSPQNADPTDSDKPDLAVTIPVSNLLTESESFANTDSLSSSTTTTVRVLADKTEDSSQDASSLPESDAPPVPKPRSPKPTESISSLPEMESPKRQRVEPQDATDCPEESEELVAELPAAPVKRRQKSSQSRSSRSGSSKYRSGLVLDDEVSMEEMEAQIENEMLSQAATKIQAGFRGYKTRKSFRQSGVSSSAAEDSAAAAPPPESLSLATPETTAAEAAGNSGPADTTPETNSSSQELPLSGASAAFSHEESFQPRRAHEGSCPPETTTSSNSKPSLALLRSRSYPGSAEGDALIEVDEVPQPQPDVEYDPDYINNAATVIQATIRGFLVRKRHKINRRNKREVVCRNVSEDYEDVANPNEREYHGLIINPADRDSLSPVSDVDSEKAAVKIQAAFRGYKDRQKVRKTKKAVVTIQATVRGFLARRRLAKSMRRRSMQRRRSSAKLMSQEIQKMQKVNDAATKIQAVYRGYQVRSKIRKNPNDE